MVENEITEDQDIEPFLPPVLEKAKDRICVSPPHVPLRVSATTLLRLCPGITHSIDGPFPSLALIDVHVQIVRQVRNELLVWVVRHNDLFGARQPGDDGR